MRTLFKIILALLVLYLCGILGGFFAGVIGAIAAAYFHAGPYATTVVVRVLTTIFFCGFVLAAWVILSRRRERKSRRKNNALSGKDDGSPR
jgi:membrane protein implicated in regulation of membrane protease activity